MDKRKWHYVSKPQEFGIECDKCSGRNLAWSELDHKIWCYDCEIDTDGTNGVFNGPIMWETTMLILGVNFNRFNLETQQVEIAVLTDKEVEYITEEEYRRRVAINTLSEEKVEFI
jgi:hypothetical protein